jgi:hypothetical protein
MGGLVRFPSPPSRTARRLRVFCRQAIAQYRRTADGVPDVVIGRDQITDARRARLAQLQTRVRHVHPFGIDGEGRG